MRSLAVAAVVAVGLAAPAAAELTLDPAGHIVRTERAALDGVSRDRLERLVTRPATAEAAQDVRYDRAWLAEQPVVEGGAEWRCLAEALYFEARGETLEGQYAVAEVILNRVEHANYPDTICGVVNEGTGRRNACQFSYTCDGRPEVVTEDRAWNRLGHVARIMMEGAPRDLTRGATHYHADRVRPTWSRVYPRTARYGQHIFYRQQY